MTALHLSLPLWRHLCWHACKLIRPEAVAMWLPGERPEMAAVQQPGGGGVGAMMSRAWFFVLCYTLVVRLCFGALSLRTVAAKVPVVHRRAAAQPTSLMRRVSGPSFSLLLAVLVAVLALAAGKEKKAASSSSPAASSSSSPAATSGSSSGAAHVHNGPYAPVADLIKDGKKKSSFYSLLKKMREVKNSDAKGTEAEAKKNATRKALNGDMQKLLGDEVYQKYRQVRVANTAKAKAAGGHSSGHSTHTVQTGTSAGPSAPKAKKKPSASGAAPAAPAPAASTSSSSSTPKKTKKKPSAPAA